MSSFSLLFSLEEMVSGTFFYDVSPLPFYYISKTEGRYFHSKNNDWPWTPEIRKWTAALWSFYQAPSKKCSSSLTVHIQVQWIKAQNSVISSEVIMRHFVNEYCMDHFGTKNCYILQEVLKWSMQSIYKI